MMRQRQATVIATLSLLLSAATGCAPAPGTWHHDAGPARSTDTYVQWSPEWFRLEFSKEGRGISGYVYNPSSRMPTRMRLRVEGVDAAGKIVTETRTWVPSVPAYGRAFFQVTVADAPFYQIIVESYDWTKGN